MSKTISFIVAFFLVISIAAAVGMGVWGYQLNSKLMAAQKQLASVQGDLDKAKADNAQLSTELAQTNSTLVQTKAELVKTQSDLKAANSDNTNQQARLEKAQKIMAVADAIFVLGENDKLVKALVVDTGDSKLLNLFDTAMQTPNTNNMAIFLEYLFGAIDDALA